MSSLTERFDRFGTTSRLMSSAETNILACSRCNRPMRLTRVLPNILREVGIETAVFECAGCGASFTRTLRLG
jgi:hypothetical protein